MCMGLNKLVLLLFVSMISLSPTAVALAPNPEDHCLLEVIDTKSKHGFDLKCSAGYVLTSVKGAVDTTSYLDRVYFRAKCVKLAVSKDCIRNAAEQ